MNKCTKCGKEFEGKFCPSCGTSADGKPHCPKCGAEIQSGAKFCNECGYSFENKGKAFTDKLKKIWGKIKNFFIGVGKWMKNHVALTAIISIVLVAVIVLLCLIPVFTNIFKVSKVSKIDLGDTYAQVKEILGTPYAKESDDKKWVYYNDAYISITEAGADSLDDIESWDDLENELENEAKRYEQSYEKITVNFELVATDSEEKEYRVSSVWMDKKYYIDQFPAQKTLKKSTVLSGEITHYTAENYFAISYEAEYTDGSYVKAKANAVYQDTQTEKNDEFWADHAVGSTIPVYFSNSWCNSHPADLSVIDNPNGYSINDTTLCVLGNNFSSLSVEDKAKITDLVFKSSVTRIKDSAFSGYSNLTNVTIPSSVTSIGSSAFSGCTSLESITVDDGNANYSSQDGILYNKAKTKFIHIPKAITGNVTIPNTMTSIGSSAFGGCSSLESITIPSSVTSIGSYAFDGCTSLTSITIPSSVTSINCSFEDCPIETANIPTIAIYTLPETNLKTVVVNSGNGMGRKAFDGCTSLESITIPSSVTSIGYEAFYGCSSLTKVNYLGTIDDWAMINFENSSSNPTYYTKDLYINDVLVTNAVLTKATKISDYAFYGCTSLESITIPSSVTSIGYYAFLSCSSLKTITFEENSKLESISDYAFYNCKSLESITIPSSVTSIGQYAFYGCSSLESMTIPFVGASLNGTENTRFGYIFGADSSVYNDDYVPTSLKTVVITGGNSISSYAFSRCSSLESITIPSSVTSISSRAFLYCSSLKTITFEENSKLESIGSYAFEDCSSLKTITFEENSKLESIDFYAFRECSSLESITIPSSVTSIGSYAFSYCYKLVEVIDKTSLNITTSSYGLSAKQIITDKADSKLVQDGDYSFYNDNGNYYLLSYNGNETEITLPNKANGNSYEIYPLAFYNNTKITSITIPNSVTSISSDAFYGCSSLKTITFEENSKLESIGSYAFYNCISLESITIPSSVTSIGSYAFSGCSSLKTITFEENSKLESIGSYAFSYCSSLESITIPSSVTSIGSYAFGGCSSLKTITFEENSKLESIGDYAFSYCSSLKDINFNGTKAQWGAITNHISGSTANYTVHCSDGDIAKG